MRDTIRPSGLREGIIEINNVIPLYKEAIQTEKNIYKKKGSKGMLFDIYLQRTVAHYSVGDSKEIVTQSLLESIPAFKDSFEYETGTDYEDALWMVSLGVLCDITEEEFKSITDVLKRDNVNDALLSEIIRFVQTNWPESTLTPLWKKPYERALELHNSSAIKNYVHKYWYKENSDSYWHGLHKNTTVNNYFGYWSWESGALAKIREIDDVSLQDQKYYPYDAVHW